MATTAQTVLLLIDIQRGFDDTEHWGQTHSNPSFQQNIVKLLAYFRSQRRSSQLKDQLQTTTKKPLIIHVKHCSTSLASPLHPSKPGNEFHDFSMPMQDEIVLTKDTNSSFIRTDLEAILRERNVRRLYVTGLTVDQCVSTTVRMAANLGVCDGPDGEKGEVILIEDAVGAYEYEGLDAETIHRVHVATLKHEFCTVIKTSELTG